MKRVQKKMKEKMNKNDESDEEKKIGMSKW